MPGGRLTHQDRQAIAAGLAAGLSHAAIARRLGRPTSTVSREVSRNGGPGSYRADRAQQATGQRARRRKPSMSAAAAVPLPAASDVPGRDPQAVREFEDWLAAVLVQMGLPRMTASVLSCLSTTDSGSLTAAELVQRLRVSPASVSKAIAFLEGQGLVRRERTDRRERYIADDDAWYRAWLVSVRTNARLADIALQGAEILGAATPAGARLAEVGRFLRAVGGQMLQSAEQWWRHEAGAGRRAPG